MIKNSKVSIISGAEIAKVNMSKTIGQIPFHISFLCMTIYFFSYSYRQVVRYDMQTFLLIYIEL